MTKSLPAAPHLGAGALSRRSMETRGDQWRRRMDGWNGERRTALELYSGGHWSVVREFAESESSNGLLSFVISAGYGLVSTETRLASYGATFAIGQADSVSIQRGKAGAIENKAWWRQLCKWRPKGVSGVRSIDAAVRKWPNHVHVFALSPLYLDAISEDLARARGRLATPDNLVVISTGKKRHGELNGNVLSAPADIQSLLGGALVSLNVRLAAQVIGSIPPDELNLGEFRGFIDDLRAEAVPRKIPNRKRMTDAEVIRFIKTSASPDVANSYTKLLTSLRNSGHACEMKRFRTLFQNTVTK